MEQDLRALIQGLAPADTPVDWGVNDASTALPRIVLTLVSGTHIYAFGGPQDLRQYRVQVDCYGATYGTTKTLARSLIAGLSGHRDNNFAGIFLEAERDFPPITDAGAPVFWVSIDIIINRKE